MRSCVLVLLLGACSGGGPDTPPDAGDVEVFTETFSAGDASAWPSPWTVLGGASASTVGGGRGRLVPVASAYSLARMGVEAATVDAEVSFRVAFEDIGTQGVGFYVRQNGGWLQGTATHGAGYAAFLEGFRGSRFGVWREVDGVETELASTTSFATALASDTTYGVRFRVEQMADMTRLRARVWIAAEAEPTAWQLDMLDGTASLQDVAGGYAIDSYSTVATPPITAGTSVDDLAVTPL